MFLTLAQTFGRVAEPWRLQDEAFAFNIFRGLSKQSILIAFAAPFDVLQ